MLTRLRDVQSCRGGNFW